MNYTASLTRSELYEALGRATDALEWTAARVYSCEDEDWDRWNKLRICRAVAADVRKMLDARPKL